MLLPQPLRADVHARLDPAVRMAIVTVAEAVGNCRRERNRAVQRALREFSACATLASQDVAPVLACLAYSRQAQVDAVVALWDVVLDKENLAPLLPALGAGAVHTLMARLGAYNFVRCVRWPFGCHFAFALKEDDDQAAAAKQLCANANTVQPLWGAAFADVKLRQELHEHARQQTLSPTRRAAAPAGNSNAAAPENLADLVPATMGKRTAVSRTERRPEVDTSPEEAAKANFRRYMRALWDLEEPPGVVFDNIMVDGEPLLGRAKIQLQHLWADIAGHASHIELDFVPYAPCGHVPCLHLVLDMCKGSCAPRLHAQLCK
jgi:hypothetical protein